MGIQFLQFVVHTDLFDSIKMLPAMAFENLNSLETLNIQNNKLTRIPEEVMEPIMDTLRVVDIMGKLKFLFILLNILLIRSEP